MRLKDVQQVLEQLSFAQQRETGHMFGWRWREEELIDEKNLIGVKYELVLFSKLCKALANPTKQKVSQELPEGFDERLKRVIYENELTYKIGAIIIPYATKDMLLFDELCNLRGYTNFRHIDYVPPYLEEYMPLEGSVAWIYDKTFKEVLEEILTFQIYY